jgi:hypothetical protein
MIPMVDLVRGQNPKPNSIAIIASNSPYPLMCAKGEYAKQVGINVVMHEQFPEETSDLSSLLSLIKTKNPDLLFETGYFEHSVLITRQLKDQRFSPKALAFSVGPQLPDFTKSLGKDADYTMGVAYWHPKMKYKDAAFTIAQYNDMFKQKYGRELRKIGSRIGEKTKRRCITVLSSVIDELNRIGAKKIGVFTPYIDEVSEDIRISLEAANFEVSFIHCMGLIHNLDVGKVSPEEICHFVQKRMDFPFSVDAYFLSCTNWRAYESLPDLKRIISIPIVTSSQAVIQSVKNYLNH